ncbi:MAG TPA: hypothetical protein PKN80_04105, partial [bacterium]|nr:hypothetical protein [bacterium]
MHRRCLRFENLLLLGDGGIGRSFLHLAESELNGFRRVLVIDKAPMRLPAGRKNAETVLADLSRSGVLGSFLVKFPYGSALVLNLTLGLDHLLLRRQAAGRGAGYLDAAAGSLAAAPAENRLSRLAPYWLTPLKTEAPHWLGFGINPGLVELAARRLLEKRAAGRRRLVVFEFDRLAARLDGDRVAVGWSPAGLIEEMMRMPAFFVEADRACESADNCSGRVRVNWREKDLEVRRVAHEEIYNFSKSRRVAAAEFLYVLRPEVMRLLDGDPKGAERRLIVP